MKVLVLNGSPAGKNSITLQTVLFIEKFFKKTEFEVLHAAQKIKAYEKDFSEAEASLKSADLILFAYPVYTFLVPSQLHRFIELIKEKGIDLGGKYATQLSTSKHFYDTTAHRFIQDNCDDLGLKYIKGFTADMDDLLKEKGQKEALDFFKFVKWSMKNGICEKRVYTGREKSADGQEEIRIPAVTAEKRRPDKRIAVVADLGEGSEVLKRMIGRFKAVSGIPCDIIDISAFPFKGGCLGCFNCASDGTCVYKDGFDEFLRNNIQTADAIVYAYTVKDHSMGSRFKMFDDRQFCNGHRTVTMGKPVGYLAAGGTEAETNMQIMMEARAEAGGNFCAGIAWSGDRAEGSIDKLAWKMEYAVVKNYDPPKNFYGVGGGKIFRDLIYQMRGLMREDHRFYKKHGMYDDLPNKKKGRIIGMYLVGALMNNKKLKKKMGGKMTEGMLMPYEKALKKAEEKREGKKRV